MFSYQDIAMFEHRSEENELMDDLSLSCDDLSRNLHDIEICNRVFGSHKALINALNSIVKKYPAHFKNRKVIIADLGCGAGEQLMVMNQWAKSYQFTIQLIGVDANPFMINYAKTKSRTASNIEYKNINIFSSEFSQMQFDIITINSVCHHFNDASLTDLFRQLANQARLAVIINDLHRHWLSYYGIKWIARIFNFSYLTKHDAPLSVLRAFRKQELIDLLKQSHLNSYQIHWAWAFRWVAIIWCSKEKGAP